jgi:phosphatidylserine decarboxylase
MKPTILLGATAACLLMAPLAWKWQLGLRRVTVGLAVAVSASWAIGIALNRALAMSPVVQFLFGAVLTLATAGGAVAYRFYRDPERTAPAGEHLVVSPADGEVVYVKRSTGGRIPVSTKHGRRLPLHELTGTPVHDGEAVVVGISMSFLDVHVNRSPIAGKVLLQRHFAGRFGSLRNPEMVFANERATTVIEASGFQVAVVQIASRLVRQIVALVTEGQELDVGQRIGIIRFGSQVDLVLPDKPDLQLVVKPGDRVEAGTSVIAELRERFEAPAVRERDGSGSAATSVAELDVAAPGASD